MHAWDDNIEVLLIYTKESFEFTESMLFCTIDTVDCFGKWLIKKKSLNSEIACSMCRKTTIYHPLLEYFYEKKKKKADILMF